MNKVDAADKVAYPFAEIKRMPMGASHDDTFVVHIEHKTFIGEFDTIEQAEKLVDSLNDLAKRWAWRNGMHY